MQSRKQVTVFLENKPGRLANVLGELARHKINIIALSVMEHPEHGVLRIVTENQQETCKVITDLNMPLRETDVLEAELKNQPGSLAHICEVLAVAHIGIEYAYCSSGGRNGKVAGIFKVANVDKAIRVLNESPNNRRPERRPPRDQRVYRRA